MNPSNHPTLPTPLRILVVALLLTIIGSACNEVPDTYVHVFNASSNVIDIVDSADDSVRATLSSRETYGLDDQCDSYVDDLVFEARLSDGTWVATAPDEFCSENPRWEITQEQVDTAIARSGD